MPFLFWRPVSKSGAEKRSSTGNSVVRVARFDEEPPATIASGGDPWGIAVTCGEVFWCDNETRSLVGQAK